MELTRYAECRIYHIVCPAKYRRKVFGEAVEEVLKEVCKEISECYEIEFLEIGTDIDHVHFLVQSVPTYSVTKIVRTVKSITAREIFKRVPEVKEQLWGGNLWTSGFFVNTVGQHGNEETIGKYVREQGLEKSYKKIYSQQLKLL